MRIIDAKSRFTKKTELLEEWVADDPVQEERMASLAKVFHDDTLWRNSLKLIFMGLAALGYFIFSWSILT
tara:strand:- start:41 stop:250 length:210 start_codon:yes stop_codon:yes gene_type:complete